MTMTDDQQRSGERHEQSRSLSSHAETISERMLYLAARGKWEDAITSARQVLELDQENLEATQILDLARKEAAISRQGQEAIEALHDGRFDCCLTICDSIELLLDADSERTICSPSYIGSTAGLRKLAAERGPSFEKLLCEGREQGGAKRPRKSRSALRQALQLAPGHREAKALYASALEQCRARVVRYSIFTAVAGAVLVGLVFGVVYAMRVRETVGLFDRAVEKGMHEKAALLAPEIARHHRNAQEILSAVASRAECTKALKAQQGIVFGDECLPYRTADEAQSRGEDHFARGEYLLARSKWDEAVETCMSAPSPASVLLELSRAARPPMTVEIKGSDGDSWRRELTETGAADEAIAVTPGDYLLRITKVNCRDFEQNLILEPGKQLDLPVVLKPCPGELMVICNVPGEVRLGNQVLGSTGAWITDVPAGSQTVHVATTGYREAETAIVVEPNSRTTHNVELHRATGQLSVDIQWASSVPDDYDFSTAILKVNRSTKKVSHLPVKLALPVGEYAVSLTIAGFESDGAKRIKIRDNVTEEVSISLKPKPATIAFSCDAEAVVRIWEGDTLLGVIGDRISLSPFEEHRLEFLAGGYEKKTMKVRIPQPGASYKKPTHISLKPTNGTTSRE